MGGTTVKTLVLSGGGALGAYEAGVIEGLHRAGRFDYDLVCGTSIGALNAAFVAQHRFAELAATWHGIAGNRVITLVPAAERLQNVRRLLSSVFSKRPSWQTLVELFVIAYDLFSLWPLEGLFKILGALAPEPIRDILQNKLDFNRLVTALVVSATNLTNGRSDAFWWFREPTDGTVFAQHYDKGTAFPLRSDTFVNDLSVDRLGPIRVSP